MTTLGRVDTLQPEDIKAGAARLSTYQDALRAVYERGLAMPSMPSTGYKGDMPPNLTALDDSMLGEQLNQLSAWCAYVEAELAKADTQRKETEAQLEFVKARVRIELKARGEKLTVQDKNDYVLTDPRVVEAQSRSLYCEGVYHLTRAIREKSQRDWETVSRRITQRGQEVDRMRRESNVGGVPAANARTFRRT